MTGDGDGTKTVGVRTGGNERPAGEETGASPRAPARWASFLLLGAGLAIFIAFAATTNFHQVGSALWHARAPLLALAAAAVTAQILVKALRWRFMVERLTGVRISTRFGAISVVSGVAAGSVTPGRSFELAKAVMLKGSYEVALGVSTSAMIVERMLDLGFFVVTFLLAAAFVPSRMVLTSRVLVLVVAGLIVAFGLLVAAPSHIQTSITALLSRLPVVPAALRAKGLRLVETFFASFLLLRAQRTLWLLILLTAGSAALEVVRVVAVFAAMGIGLPIPLIAFAYLGAALLGMALLVPGGVGVTEVSMAGLIAVLAPGTVPAQLARSAVLVDRFLSYYLLVLIGAGCLIAYHRFRRIFTT